MDIEFINSKNDALEGINSKNDAFEYIIRFQDFGFLRIMYNAGVIDQSTFLTTISNQFSNNYVKGLELLQDLKQLEIITPKQFFSLETWIPAYKDDITL